jgi:rhodanese-related sulfurtransferase
MKSISSNDLRQRMANGESVCLIDVRTPAEFASGHIPHATLRPLERFDAVAFAKERGGGTDAVHVICLSGTRASRAIKQLEAAGVCNCILVDGGIEAWTKAGFELERHGKAMMSLERQVRIAAGFLVSSGTLLGVFMHSAFLVIPGFVGAGLVFAGISDICGMGMLLAKMPWNQVKCGTNHQACCRGNV